MACERKTGAELSSVSLSARLLLGIRVIGFQGDGTGVGVVGIFDSVEASVADGEIPPPIGLVRVDSYGLFKEVNGPLVFALLQRPASAMSEIGTNRVCQIHVRPGNRSAQDAQQHCGRQNRTTSEPRTNLAGADGPTEHRPKDTARAVGDIGDVPRPNYRQHNAEKKSADHPLNRLAIDEIAEARVAAAKHPEQAEQTIHDA